MKIQDTFEYRLVKQITAKENRRNIIKTILAGTLLVVTTYFFMYVIMWVMLAIWYA
jgi:hypothetical protein